MQDAALQVDGLRITYPGTAPVQALDGITFDLGHGECLGILGESGSGKSTLSRSLLGLNTDAVIEGSVRLGDIELTDLDEAEWQRVRWRRIALVFQSVTALNPVLRIGRQVAEPLETHLGLSRDEAATRAGHLLDRVGLDPTLARRFPRELSGGQRRLVLLATALACDPDVLVLDEPTAGLDPLTRRRVLALLQELRDTEDRSLVVLTHDVDALAVLADRVMVLYRGWIAELGPTAAVLDDPRNPYTFGLLNARPTLATLKELGGIRGAPPDPTQVAVGCPFRERCTQAIDDCDHDRPAVVAPPGEDGSRVVACVRGGIVPVLRAHGLHKTYRVRTGALRHETVTAVDGVDLEVREGEVVGLVGPNGAGKSTLGKLLLRLLEADSGSIELDGHDLLEADEHARLLAARRGQMLFQDPYDALSPRLTVAQAVQEPLDVQGIGTPEERRDLVARTLEDVRLPPSAGFLDRHTHELSGGQLQRVGLARALVLRPKLLIADEPYEGLDPSEQAKMLRLLRMLQIERGMAMVLVSHDLAVVLRTVDRVVVMDQGRIVEQATGRQLLTSAAHPVTRALLEASGAGWLLGDEGAPAATPSRNGHRDTPELVHTSERPRRKNHS